MKKIKKMNLVDEVYNSLDYSKQTVQDVIDAFLIQLEKDLADGATIELRGLGTFEPRLRKGRDKARNPKTGESCKVAPHYVEYFRAGMELKKALRDLEIDDK